MNFSCVVQLYFYMILHWFLLFHFGTNQSASNGRLSHVEQQHLESKHGLELSTSIGALRITVSSQESALHPDGRNSPLTSQIEKCGLNTVSIGTSIEFVDGNRNSLEFWLLEQLLGGLAVGAVGLAEDDDSVGTDFCVDKVFHAGGSSRRIRN